MPWTVDDVDGFKRGLSADEKRQWVAVANDALARCMKDGGAQATCEASAIRQASGSVGKTATWQRDFTIAKTDSDQRLVFGWLSVAVDKAGNVVEDSQGDIIAPEELEKAAYKYVLLARRAGEMHERLAGQLVESMVFTKEKQAALGIPEGTVPVGWWIGYYISSDQAWAKVKDGTYTAFSIGGRGMREKVE